MTRRDRERSRDKKYWRSPSALVAPPAEARRTEKIGPVGARVLAALLDRPPLHYAQTRTIARALGIEPYTAEREALGATLLAMRQGGLLRHPARQVWTLTEAGLAEAARSAAR